MTAFKPQFDSEYWGDVKSRRFVGRVEKGSASDPTGLKRVKVRVHGLHTEDTSKIDTDDLPWAQVIIPGTEPGTNGTGWPGNIEEGALVFGEFLDGPTSQIPVVYGSLPRIDGNAGSSNLRTRGGAVGVGAGEAGGGGGTPADTAWAGDGSGNLPPGSPTYVGTGYPPDLSEAAIEGMITEEANLRGIPPYAAIAVYRAEGRSNYRAQAVLAYGQEESYGPYQMHTRGGMGNEYEQATGRSLATDNTREGIRTQIQFALDQAARGGSWQPWSAVKNGSAGIGLTEGLGNARPAGNWK
jgi:hypothetical protein